MDYRDYLNTWNEDADAWARDYALDVLDVLDGKDKAEGKGNADQ